MCVLFASLVILSLPWLLKSQRRITGSVEPVITRPHKLLKEREVNALFEESVSQGPITKIELRIEK